MDLESEIGVGVRLSNFCRDHVEQIKEQLSREPRPLPKLWLNPEIKNIFDFTIDDVKVLDYDPWPAIKGKVSV